MAIMANLTKLLESPYWPEDDLPPYGSLVLEGIELYERLIREVRIATRLELSTEPDLMQNLTPCLTAALTKRFNTIDKTLKRLEADIRYTQYCDIHYIYIYIVLCKFL